jgi:hypothetical protein
MSIVLRTNKGSALTYDEMDRNQSQFFYSSSLVDDGATLRLHYTGSDNLDTTEGLQVVDYGPTRYQDIPFPQFDISNIPQSNVAGQANEIQFRDDVNDDFGADSLFVFRSADNSMGLGVTIPTTRLTIAGDGSHAATIALSGHTASDSLTNRASIKFFTTGFGTAALVGQLGKLQHIDNSSNIDDVFIHAGTEDITSTASFVPTPTSTRKVHIALGDVTNSENSSLTARIGATFQRNGLTSARLGINTENPTNILNVVGNAGVALSNLDPEQATDIASVIKPVSLQFYNETLPTYGVTKRKLYPDGSAADGLEIVTPGNANGGNVVVVLNTGAEKAEGFNIIATQQNSPSNAEVLATFQGSGKVGIGTNFPAHTGLTIQEQLSIKSLTASDPFEEISKTLVADSTGLVKEVVAAPVPLGGIIMWSGDTNGIPEGWRLCKNGVGTVNNVVVPNLSNKFIIASSNSTGAPTTTIEGLGTGPTSTGGSTSYTPAGILVLDKLTHRDIPPHHHFFLGDDRLYNRIPASTSSADNSIEAVGGPGSASSNSTAPGFRIVLGYDAVSNNDSNDDRRLYATSHNNANDNNTSSTVMTDNLVTVPTGAFTGTTASKAIIPPYYALAYIIYVGV